jgi:signal peptidase
MWLQRYYSGKGLRVTMGIGKTCMEILKKAIQLLLGLVCALAFVSGVALLGLKAFGWQTLVVQTGSMQNLYPVGTLLVVRGVEPEQVQVGDVISYVADEALTVVTHRVVEVDAEAGYFITQGDQNNAPDGEPVLYENLIGKVAFGIPVLGRALDWVHEGHHGALFIGILVVGVLAQAGYTVYQRRMDRGKKAAHEQDVKNLSKQ